LNSDEMFLRNKMHYEVPGRAEIYARKTSLHKAEEVIFAHLAGKMRGQPVLDIGVGQGRTTPYLRALSDLYVGIDYSANMLNACRAKYPDAALLLCDGRQLSFGDETFEVVYFCWNAIDDLDHEDRLRILGEVHRVLRKGGVFFFSSHNRDGRLPSAFDFGGFVGARRPLELVTKNTARVGRYLFNVYNHLRNRKHERHLPHYSIVNDGDRFRLMTYYIDKESQIAQLEAAGFGDVEVVGLDGSFVARDERCRDNWLFYIARKG